MKNLIKLIVGLTLSIGLLTSAFAQSNSNVTTTVTIKPGFFSRVGSDITAFIKANPDALSQTNWSLSLGGNYAAGKVGASANVSYSLNAYMRPGFELDYINGVLYDGTLNTSVGTSYKLFNLNAYSYVIAGVGTVVSGSNSGSLVNYQGVGTEFGLPFGFKLFGKYDSNFGLTGEVDHYNAIVGPVIKGFIKFNISF